MTRVYQLKACWDKNEVFYSYRLRPSTSSKSWQAIDVTLRCESKTRNLNWPDEAEALQIWYFDPTNGRSIWRQMQDQDWGSPKAQEFLVGILKSAATIEDDSKSIGQAVRLLFPSKNGYLVRSDFLSLRMVDLELVDAVVSFHAAEPGKLFGPPAVDTDTKTLLPQAIFSTAVGGFLIRQPSTVQNDHDVFKLLDVELNNRLDFPWLTAVPAPRKTLAILEGGRTSPDQGGTATSIYAAACALNIDMIVLDVSGHWLEGPQYAHWRKEFLPIELDLNPIPSVLAELVIRTLDGREIDGIVTWCGPFQSAVASVAEQLGLPTAPTEAYEIATNKYRTSISEGRPAYRAHSLEDAIEIAKRDSIRYPLIVKPCNGWLSEGVCKINNLKELVAAVTNIDSNRHGKEFMLEQYCDGPEVDINFVLCEGQLLFCEISDDFPKTADLTSYAGENDEKGPVSFIELANVMPSKLPDVELNILRDSLHHSLVRLGLTTGIYHLEARVHNSSMEYGIVNPDTNIIDLISRTTSAVEAPSAWLIEINPRPPGIQETAAVESTYGVDYWGIGLLAALQDNERMRALAHPFRRGPQYWCEMVFIPVSMGGTFASDDVCIELMQRHPDLAKHISRCFCFLKRGDKVLAPESGITSWVAYFVVFSRLSREHLLEVTATLRREIRFTVS